MFAQCWCGTVRVVGLADWYLYCTSACEPSTVLVQDFEIPVVQLPSTGRKRLKRGGYALPLHGS